MIKMSFSLDEYISILKEHSFVIQHVELKDYFESSKFQKQK